MSLLDNVDCPVVARFGTGADFRIAQRAGSAWGVWPKRCSRPVLLDERLQRMRSIRVRGLGWREDESHLDVEPELGLVAIASPSEVRVGDLDGRLLHRFRFPSEWDDGNRGGVRLTSDGRLWFVRPPHPHADMCVLVVADTGSGSLLAELPVVWGYGHDLWPVPTSDSVLLSVSEAPEWTAIYRIDTTDGAYSAMRYPFQDRSVHLSGAVSIDGSEFITGPNAEGDSVAIHRMADGAEVAAMYNDVFPEEDPFADPDEDEFDDLWPVTIFLADPWLLGCSEMGRLLLIDRRSMTVKCVIRPDGAPQVPHWDLLRPLGKAGEGLVVVEQSHEELLLLDVSAACSE